MTPAVKSKKCACFSSFFSASVNRNLRCESGSADSCTFILSTAGQVFFLKVCFPITRSHTKLHKQNIITERQADVNYQLQKTLQLHSKNYRSSVTGKTPHVRNQKVFSKCTRRILKPEGIPGHIIILYFYFHVRSLFSYNALAKPSPKSHAKACVVPQNSQDFAAFTITDPRLISSKGNCL